MEIIRLFHFVLRWLTVLIEAGALIWLALLVLALLGWVLWGVLHLSRRGFQAAAQPSGPMPPLPVPPPRRARRATPREDARR